MMTMVKRSVVQLSVIFLAVSVQAADRTWDGGGSDANWSRAANWDGDATVPASADALYFGGTAKLVNTNDLTDGTLFAGLTFNSGAGAFTLAGNRITLGGNVTNWSASTQTLSLPLILSGTRDFVASNGTITVNSLLSGPGGLTKFGNQWMNLNASNSYDGVTTVSNGTLAVYHSNALGSTNGNTVIQGTIGGKLYLGSNLTITEPLLLNGELNNGGTVNSSSGSNFLSGPITCFNQVRLQISGNALFITGGVTQSDGGGLFVVNASSTMIFSTASLNLGARTFYTDSGGLTVLGVAGNTWVETLVANGTLRLDVPNALPPTASLKIGIGYGNYGGTLNLNGNNQTVSKLYPGTTTAGTRAITSPTPAILTVNQSVDTTFDGPFTGAAGLCKTGAGKLTLTNAAMTTMGDFIVSNGTLVVTAASSLGNSTNILVAGGTLELQTGTAIADSAALSILDGGAKVKIATNLTETVDRLFLADTQQISGTYGATAQATVFDNVHFSGGGLLRVLSNPPLIPTNYVWDAGGSDTYLNTATNWVNDVVPEFTGTSWLVFGNNGSTATVNTSANLYGMTFNRDANFTVANGDGFVTLGLGGLTAYAPTATARVYTLAADVILGADQTWSITNLVGGTTLTVSGVIGDGTNSFGFTKLGNGTLVLSGNNTYDGVTTNWCGAIQITHSNALGSTAGGTVINTAGASSASLNFNGGITLAEPLTFIGGSVNGGCLVNGAGTNTISGLITTAGGRYVASSGVLNITGGVLGVGSNPFFVVNAGSTIAFTTTPLSLGGGTFHTDSGGLTILGVASNKWGDTLFTGGTLRLDAAYAFPTSTLLKVGGVWYGPNCTLNLNGNDQMVGTLSRAESTPGTIVITSETPATLTVNQSGNTGYDGMFSGNVSLLKLGTGTLTLTNAATSTAGSFIVSNGTLVVGSNGTLGNNSTNIVVGGTGTLTLQNSTTLADTATLSIANGGTAKVSLSSGVNESVNYLFLGDKQKRVGAYGATGSGANVIDDEHFAGTGILTVLHDKSGMLIKVR